jgi:hypothetical protein
MKLFISYRREDSSGHAGRLFDHLSARFGEKNIFMDIDTIEPGQDFRKVVENAVGTCDVVLAVMGKQWLNISDAQGQRRLDNPRDWVRMEIASALANSRVRVIPVLVGDASMPASDQLPDELKELAWRNAIELSNSRFQHDARKLVGVIERATGQPAKPLPARGRPGLSAIVLGILLGVMGFILIAWPVGYAIFAFPDYVEGDWWGFPIAFVGLILSVIAYRLLRR